MRKQTQSFSHFPKVAKQGSEWQGLGCEPKSSNSKPSTLASTSVYAYSTQWRKVRSASLYYQKKVGIK